MAYNGESRMSFHGDGASIANIQGGPSSPSNVDGKAVVFQDDMVMGPNEGSFWVKVRHGTPTLCIPIFIMSFAEKMVTISMSATSSEFGAITTRTLSTTDVYLAQA
ncbi:hypothetical protein SARC_06851 [Sphaeroforma arctica JP610]|uniref:Uncharacterized protein n=1 Tax=Sphaeroforma arctica JP610 TaxID=667725 RepID=A0A0L0FVE0_9EUKA|nr:hypothetical protein SARC_06851 [Sphaeroforma arctica JP610]KNC80802.1 hypothetical protein SARC_06851 [Sphaeroforma arctica JP610]|eukprot:XP_014154704.1 hypothetical protein SARC_06851 [Sphaeroforma arctica JP610]